MIYYHLQTQSVLDAYFYLEELICLSKITNQKCGLKISTEIAYLFDLSEFEIVENLPVLPKLFVSDYVCVYSDDLLTPKGDEFCFYKPKRTTAISRLDKYQNCILDLRRPNFYESKYFTNKTVYKIAIKHASIFDFKYPNIFTLEKIKSLVKPLPFVCLNSSVSTNPSLSLPFKEFYYYSENDVSECLKEYNAYSISDYIYGYFPNENPYIYLSYLTNNFKDIYGQTNDLLYAIMCKNKYKYDPNWKINIIGYNYGFVTENNNPRLIHPHASFDFSKYDINMDRKYIVSLMRSSNCSLRN